MIFMIKDAASRSQKFSTKYNLAWNCSWCFLGGETKYSWKLFIGRVFAPWPLWKCSCVVNFWVCTLLVQYSSDLFALYCYITFIYLPIETCWGRYVKVNYFQLTNPCWTKVYISVFQCCFRKSGPYWWTLALKLQSLCIWEESIAGNAACFRALNASCTASKLQSETTCFSPVPRHGRLGWPSLDSKLLSWAEQGWQSFFISITRDKLARAPKGFTVCEGNRGEPSSFQSLSLVVSCDSRTSVTIPSICHMSVRKLGQHNPAMSSVSICICCPPKKCCFVINLGDFYLFYSFHPQHRSLSSTSFTNTYYNK